MELRGIIAELRAAADRLEALPPAQMGADPLGGLERAAIAEEVASLVRHDLRNSLASIRNAAYYLRRRTEGTEVWASDPRIAQFFGLIDESVTNSTGMLEERLALQHLFTRRVTRVAGQACVARAIACARVAPAQRPELDPGAAPGDLEVDPHELALAVRCLIENAAEAVAGLPPRVTARALGARFVITVTDEGAGIAEADLGLIFEPLRTTKPGHTGLGLNVAQRVARRYSGALTVTSGPTGTIAALAVPLAGEAVT